MFEKDGFKIEKLIHRKLPLLAKAKLESKKYNEKLKEYFEKNEWIKI